MRRSVQHFEEEYADLVNFDILNIDLLSVRPLAIEHNVSFIPLIVLLDGEGNVVMRLEGYQTEEQLRAALEALVEGAKTDEDDAG